MASNISLACIHAHYSLFGLHKYNIISRTRSFRRTSLLFFSRRKPVYRKKRLPSIPRRQPSLYRRDSKFRFVEILFIMSLKIASSLKSIWSDQSVRARRLRLTPVGTWRQLIALCTMFPALAYFQSFFVVDRISPVFILNVHCISKIRRWLNIPVWFWLLLIIIYESNKCSSQQTKLQSLNESISKKNSRPRWSNRKFYTDFIYFIQI